MITDPDEAAAQDVRAALHLPGARRSWSPRYPVQLPLDDAGRRDWLRRYADALQRVADEGVGGR